MKKMRKLLCIVLSVVMVLATSVCGFGAVKPEDQVVKPQYVTTDSVDSRVVILNGTASYYARFEPKTGNWSSYAVMTLNASDGWKQASHSSLKATGNDVATFFVDSKTMYTSPDAKLVNSKGENRSAIVSLSSVNTRINAAGNTGTKGYYYYSKVKPSGFQIGQDSIKYKIMAD